MTDKLRAAVPTVLTNVSNYPEGVQRHVWGRSLSPLIDRVTDAVRSVLAEQGEPEGRDMITIKRPVVPHGPHHMTENQGTAHYMREIIRKIESKHINVGGSNVTRTLKDLLAHVAMTLERLPVEENTPHTMTACCTTSKPCAKHRDAQHQEVPNRTEGNDR